MTSTSAPSEAYELPAQGTPEWLALRRTKIGSSDVGVLMGESEFSTPYQIWLEKTGRSEGKEINLAMMRGSETEGKIRALYELNTGNETPPCVVQGQGVPWAMVSLDGYDESQGLVVELKYPGRETHEEARQGKVPKKYYGQVQYQLAVTGAKRAHYVSYQEDPETKEPSIEIVPVLPDQEYWSRLFPVLECFWRHVETDIPPPLCDRDIKELYDAHNMDIFGRWKQAKLISMQLDDMLDKIKIQSKHQQGLLQLARVEIEEIVKNQHPKIRCNGVRAITVKRKSGPSLDVRLDGVEE